MIAQKVVKFIGHLLDTPDPEITLKLERIVYSPKHKHEICIVQLVGKNAFPKLTPEEILSDPKAMKGLSVDNIITITRLDEQIRRRKNTYKILEVDKNGTILLEDHRGKIKRYSEKNISFNREIIKNMDSLDAHDLGYRVGFREGLSISSMKEKAKEKARKLINNGFSFISRKIKDTKETDESTKV